MKDMILASNRVQHLNVTLPLFPLSHPDAYELLDSCIREVITHHRASLQSVGWGCEGIDIVEVLRGCPNLTSMSLWTSTRTTTDGPRLNLHPYQVWHKLRSLQIFELTFLDGKNTIAMLSVNSFPCLTSLILFLHGQEGRPEVFGLIEKCVSIKCLILHTRNGKLQQELPHLPGVSTLGLSPSGLDQLGVKSTPNMDVFVVLGFCMNDNHKRPREFRHEELLKAIRAAASIREPRPSIVRIRDISVSDIRCRSWSVRFQSKVKDVFAVAGKKGVEIEDEFGRHIAIEDFSAGAIKHDPQ